MAAYRRALSVEKPAELADQALPAAKDAALGAGEAEGLPLILAFLAESVTEDFFGPLAKLLAEKTGMPLLGELCYVAALIGIGLCVAYKLDLLLAAGFEAQPPLMGFVLTRVV